MVVRYLKALMAFALLNVAGNMCLGLGAVAIGWVAAKAICT